MTTKSYGLYIHLPFCVKRCNYCDFCSSAGRLHEDIDLYVSRLVSEICSYNAVPKVRLDTIYFGGGTPSLLDAAQIHRILHVVHSVFCVEADAELSMEVNPGTITRGKAGAYRSMGINRISIGLQSTHENELKILGRIHNYDDFCASYYMLRDFNFDNINVDLMYGIPDQTVGSFATTLERVISIMPEHISAYGLIVEPGTPFYERRASLNIPQEDDECAMYYLAAERLGAAGYNHYEISNYARDGRQSRHNLKYWRDEEYIGVGASAYSYYGGRRYGNTSSIDDYLSGVTMVDSENITKRDMAYEYAMMRLRLREGFSLSEYQALFGNSFMSGKEQKVANYLRHGLINICNDRISLTERGFYVSNTILGELL